MSKETKTPEVPVAPEYTAIFTAVYEAAKGANAAKRTATEQAAKVRDEAIKRNSEAYDDAVQALETARQAVSGEFDKERRALDEAKRQVDKAAQDAYDETIRRAVEAANETVQSS
ncbi:MAG TPA: hypothetical protein VFV36_11075 [Candidatus Methylomirabilis sp.]|nr:hypothetical protein [Candidatus Methylomirabilis sp.]